MTNNAKRRLDAYEVRENAARVARDRVQPEHIANGDETKFRFPKEIENSDADMPGEMDRCERDPRSGRPSYLASYTKGLRHRWEDGLIDNPEDFIAFVRAIDSGDVRDIADMEVPTFAEFYSSKASENQVCYRAFESQGSGNTFDLEGPDAQAVTMPPAPSLGSDESIAEMGEVYVQALLRDVPFTDIVDGSGALAIDGEEVGVADLIEKLNHLPWFKQITAPIAARLNEAELSRKRGPLTCATAFRGITPGDNIGPYISQFLLTGTGGINSRDDVRQPSCGLVTYGSITIDQRVRVARDVDYMNTWEEWLDVQNGADFRALEEYVSKDDCTEAYPSCTSRFIYTPRDLATYVHYDALYEAYLNACLILLANGVPFDPGLPFQLPDSLDKQQGFAQFGGPHILSLVTEVATRALKAVRFQKFNVHRRMRPEAYAARLVVKDIIDVPEIHAAYDQLRGILHYVQRVNPPLETKADPAPEEAYYNYLLPMAFCEGSPMHPAYGAGHATVAGACVTILKAFFDHTAPLDFATGDAGKAFVACDEGRRLEMIDVSDEHGCPTTMTVEGELNKLASNISIGRDWAGVHYFTDYIESIRMGERIAIGILEEQKLTFGENFSMTIPLYDGGAIRI